MKYEFKGSEGEWRALIKNKRSGVLGKNEGFTSEVIFGYKTHNHCDVWIHRKGEQTMEDMMLECISNVSLIAGAPDLLKACVEALAELELTNAYHPLQLKLQAAIHKALNIT